MANLSHATVKQKYKHIFKHFSKTINYSCGPNIKIRYIHSDIVTSLKIQKNEVNNIKVLGIYLVFDWPKTMMAEDRKMETKFVFKILAKDGRYFTRDVETDITSSNKSTGFASFLPLCELYGGYFLENDQLTVEVEGVIEPPSHVDHTKKIILRIPFISKMKKTHSSVLFKHDLGLQWRIHTEYYEGDRPFYDVYLEAVGPYYKWSCDVQTKLSLVKNFNDTRFCRTKELRLSNDCTILHIGQYNIDEVFDPTNGLVDNFDTLTFQFLLHIYHIHGLYPDYDDSIRGIMPIVMNKLPENLQEMKSYLSFEIKVPKLSGLKSAVYSVLDYAQNLFWVAFLRIEKIQIINQLETEALGVYVHCFDPNSLTNWSCESNVRFILKAKKNENNLERRITHTFSSKQNTFGFNNMLLIKEIECSNRHYLLNSGISVVFVIDCKPRQITDIPINISNILAKRDTQGTIKMIVKDFSRFSGVQVTPEWVVIGSTPFKIMVMTHHKLFHNTVVDKVLAFYVKCDSTKKPKDWRCNTQVALKMKCHLTDMTDLVLKFEFQFTKDNVFFGFEEFLLVSVILNPAHGFIFNDAIELEAFIEVTNEILDDNKVVHIDTNDERYIESCYDESICNMWNNQKLVEDATGLKMIEDWNEEQCGTRYEKNPYVNAALATVENDVSKNLAPSEDFNYEEAIEPRAYTCKEELPENNVVIIKTKVVTKNYYDNEPMEFYKENPVMIMEGNYFSEVVEDPVKIDRFNDLVVKPHDVNQFEEQLIANEDVKLETTKDEKLLDFTSEKVVIVSEIRNNSGQLDSKDLQSLTVENLHLMSQHEISCQNYKTVLKQENQNISDENNKNIFTVEENVIFKRDKFDEQLVAKICNKKEVTLEAFEEVKLEALKKDQQSISAEYVDLEALREVKLEALEEVKLEALEEVTLEALEEVKLETLEEVKLETLEEVKLEALKEEEQSNSAEYVDLEAAKEVELETMKEVELETMKKVEVETLEEFELEALKEEEQSNSAEYVDLETMKEVEPETLEEVKLEALVEVELEALKEENQSYSAGYVEEKLERVLEVSSQVAVTASNITVNPVDFVDEKDLHSSAVENLYLEIKLDHEDKESCQNCEINFDQEDKNVTNENQDLMNDVNLPYVRDENKESCVQKQLIAKVDSWEQDKNEHFAASLKVEDFVFPTVKDSYSEKVDSKYEVTCPNCKIEFKQKDMKVSDEKPDLMNCNNRPKDQITINVEVNVTDEKEESCVEEENVASQEVEAVSKVEDNSVQPINIDSLSPAVKSLYLKHELDPKDEVSCMNKSSELCNEKEEPNPNSEALFRTQRNNPKDMTIPKIIIESYEDNAPPEEYKAASLSAEAVKQFSSNVNLDTDYSENDVSEKSTHLH